MILFAARLERKSFFRIGYCNGGKRLGVEGGNVCPKKITNPSLSSQFYKQFPEKSPLKLYADS